MKCQTLVSGAFKHILILVILKFLGRNNSAIGDFSEESFDFIVVGGGSAGCVLASRLSETGEHTVLLLEAGGTPDPELDVPALLPNHLTGESVKTYRSTPLDNAALSENGTVTILAGWTLGGGSAINGMVFNRGHPRDYEIWAERTGDPSWRYENMMKYFKKVEDYAGYFPSDQHGYGGPITVSGPRYAPGMKTLFAAGMSLGYPVADQNGPQKLSFSPTERTEKHGRRVSSLKGYIEPIIDSRRNLKITQNAYARRILFGGKKAVGVVYRSSLQQDVIVRANKEIIITAGTWESPAFLMKSGIGPRDILRENKIPPVRHLPVGKNFQDHVAVRLEFTINDRSPSQVFIPERELTPQNFAIYNQTGNGPYSSLDGSNVQAFLSSSKAKLEGNGDWSDLQILFNNGPGYAHIEGVVGTPSSDEDNTDDGSGDVSVAATLFLTRPKSIGEIRLNKDDPEGDPIIDLGYLSHPDDLEIMLDGVKQTLQIFEGTPAYQQLGARYQRRPLPACDHLPFRSDNYWRCFIAQNTQSGLHAVGTCSMGKGPQDPMAVVDTNFKVIGLEGLRVADGSVIPQLPNANTIAPIYAAAEKASEKILQSWRTTPYPQATAISHVYWGTVK